MKGHIAALQMLSSNSSEKTEILKNPMLSSDTGFTRQSSRKEARNMNRTLFLIPQFPTKMRYQSWFFSEFPRELRKRFGKVVVIGKKYVAANAVEGHDSTMFSPVCQAIEFETRQIEEYLSLDVGEDDILLLLDLSFPGIFPSVLYHKRPTHCYAYCHATSLNLGDYFEKDRPSKYETEYGHSKLFTKIFVGSEYHKQKLGWENVEVLGLPLPPFATYKTEEKIYDIVSVARPCEQKVTKQVENEVEKEFGRITRKQCTSWEEYNKFLGRSKVLLISSKEDTFNYSILDAVLNGCIPVAPNKLCFPELLPRFYLYDSTDDLKKIVRGCLDGEYRVPSLLNMAAITSFYDNLSNWMIGESTAETCRRLSTTATFYEK
jgi:hypothetical protein